MKTKLIKISIFTFAQYFLQTHAFSQSLNGKSLEPVSVVPQINSAIFAAIPANICSKFANLQACHDALPSTGGVMQLPANYTYSISSTINITKPNVVVQCPSWGTVLQRASGFTSAQIINITGANDQIVGCTIDGNSISNSTTDIALSGNGDLGNNLQVINGAGSVQIAVSGINSRLTRSTITGLGTTIDQTYGVWAISHATVFIDHNIVTNTGIDGIGFDGTGSQVTDNYLTGCHTYTGQAGGQIVSYPYSQNVLISNNTIGQGSNTSSYALELDGYNTNIVGNSISNQNFIGILLESGSGYQISGNTIRNSGVGEGNVDSDGILIGTGITHITIVGNRIIDDQGTHTQEYAVLISGSVDYLDIEGNDLSNNLIGPIDDTSTSVNRVIKNNIGIDTVAPSIASTATLVLPLNPVVNLTGTTAVTSISADSWNGRQITIIPASAVTFTAGNNIANTLTASANVQIVATYNGTNWYLK